MSNPQLDKPIESPVLVVRVYEGSDCVYRYLFGPKLSTDVIVWGTHLYNVRFKWKSLSANQILALLAKRTAEGKP